jgi:hypothetical protein
VCRTTSRHGRIYSDSTRLVTGYAQAGRLRSPRWVSGALHAGRRSSRGVRTWSKAEAAETVHLETGGWRLEAGGSGGAPSGYSAQSNRRGAIHWCLVCLISFVMILGPRRHRASVCMLPVRRAE